MTNTSKLGEYLQILEADLGFLPDPFHDEWFVHESEPVRLIVEDHGSWSFKAVRHEGRIEGPILSKLAFDNLGPAEFRAVLRGFLHG